MSFGTRLKERREAVNITQKELGQLLGVSGNAVGNYEKGISSPNADALYKVFDALKCDANYLFQDEMSILDFDEVRLSEEESSLVRDYRLLNKDGKKYILQTMSMARRCYSEKTTASISAISHPDLESAARGGDIAQPSAPIDPDEVADAVRSSRSELE